MCRCAYTRRVDGYRLHPRSFKRSFSVIIVMGSRSREDIDRVVAKVIELGYKPHLIEGVERTVIGAVGDERGKMRLQSLESLPGVEQVVPILKPFKLAGRELIHEDTIIDISGVKLGGGHFCVIAGPCSVESREQIFESAQIVKNAGAAILRGGAFKPRTSPYSFQGLEEEGLILLEQAGKEVGLPVITEVLTPEQVPLVEKYVDMLQVGARNMQNFALLKAVGKAARPVFLKRGMMSTINELLMSAEYVMSEGNRNVILCERGIRTFETETRNTLDLSAIPVLKKLTHLPVVADPSHGTGHWDLVKPMARAAVAAGADGLMIEIHPHPEDAFSDGSQSLKPSKFEALMKEVAPLVEMMGKKL
ncbi:MAG: 3-deoxy-7-phosphoheptulonate synthase [Candidatus Hydrogenedentes bacterium]|nr:3-deoxy-7-phosphoheptulonate synthase [Candidatus Hydrogenedentota bacterium]